MGLTLFHAALKFLTYRTNIVFQLLLSVSYRTNVVSISWWVCNTGLTLFHAAPVSVSLTLFPTAGGLFPTAGGCFIQD